MDKMQMITDHLAQAERHVREVETHINSQQRIIRNLEPGGHHVTAVAEAKSLLETFQASQQIHVADRDRLRREAAKLAGQNEKPDT
jgi:hypothetical protein